MYEFVQTATGWIVYWGPMPPELQAKYHGSVKVEDLCLRQIEPASIDRSRDQAAAETASHLAV